MKTSFAPATAIEIVYEGGYVNHPKDPGGPTKFGITLYALGQHRHCACNAADVQALTAAEASTIYGEVYWPAIRGDDLPPGVDLMVYDAAINMGRGRAARLLQGALNDLHKRVTVDGSIGPGTLAATAAQNDLGALVVAIGARREALYRSFDGFPTFGDGWLNRLADVTHRARVWAAQGGFHA